MGFDRKTLVDLIRELLQTSEYEDISTRIKVLAEKDPHEYYVHQLQLEVVNLGGMMSALHDIEVDQEPYFHIASFSLWDLGERAREANYPRYADFIERFKRRLIFDLEALKRSRTGLQLLPKRDFSNASECLESMRDLLETYQRRLRFCRGLLDIVCDKKPSFKRLDRLSVPKMEKDLSRSFKGLAKGILLGHEYRHIGNSLAHNQLRIYRRRRAVEFTDRHYKTGSVWKRTYQFVDFAVLYRHLFIFMCAMELADAAGRVAEFGFLASASDKPNPNEAK